MYCKAQGLSMNTLGQQSSNNEVNSQFFIQSSTRIRPLLKLEVIALLIIKVGPLAMLERTSRQDPKLRLLTPEEILLGLLMFLMAPCVFLLPTSSQITSL
jgi:hypothetical protein